MGFKDNVDMQYFNEDKAGCIIDISYFLLVLWYLWKRWIKLDDTFRHPARNC